MAILNGGLDRPSRNEDADAPRRLFYVAMTRARTSLTPLTQGRHPLVQEAEEAALRPSVTPDVSAVPELRKRYIALGEKPVDLSLAGRLFDRNPTLGAIAAARPGDPVRLVREGDKWLIKNEAGITLSRMARAFFPPDGRSFLRGQIGAIVRWRAKDSDEEFRAKLRRQEWEVVLPELVFGDSSQRSGTEVVLPGSANLS